MINDLSACEKMVMRVVWDAAFDISIQELQNNVRDQFDKDYARSTITTLVKRLKVKGFITTYHQGKCAYIKPKISREEYLDVYFDDIVKFWFEGDVCQFVNALFRNKKISKSEKQILRGFVKEHCKVEK